MGTCWTCHGKSGTGDGPAGAALNPPPRDFTTGEFKFDANKDGKPGEPEDLFMVIKNGAAAYGGNPSMTPWGHLGDEQIKDLVAYVLSMSKS
jgi:mono/diheme cytochrome c family protein